MHRAAQHRRAGDGCSYKFTSIHGGVILPGPAVSRPLVWQLVFVQDLVDSRFRHGQMPFIFLQPLMEILLDLRRPFSVNLPGCVFLFLQALMTEHILQMSALRVLNNLFGHLRRYEEHSTIAPENYVAWHHQGMPYPRWTIDANHRGIQPGTAREGSE